jgi:hypothetical protein
MAEKYQYKVSMNFPGYANLKDINFLTACSILEGYIDAEKKALSEQINIINNDQWFVSWVSETLGNVRPPSDHKYLIAAMDVRAAKMYYKIDELEKAGKYLQSAVQTYSDVHKKWVEYRNGIIGGAERAITGMEITIAVTQVYIGVATGGGSLIVTAGIGAGVAGATELTKKGGLVLWGLKSKLTINDFLEIGGNIVESFATSLVGGKLGKFFLGKFVPKFSAIAEIDPQMAKEAFKRGILPEKAFTYCQRGIADFATTLSANAIVKPVMWVITQMATLDKGKKMTMDSFVDDVITKLIKDRYDTAANIFFLWLKKK